MITDHSCFSQSSSITRSSFDDAPMTFETVAAVPRSRFSLHWLSPATHTTSQAKSHRFISAYISPLEVAPRNYQSPLVLVVKSEGRLYVIERVERCAYAVRLLAEHVSIADCLKLPGRILSNNSWTISGPPKLEDEDEPVLGDSNVWWQSATISEDTRHKTKEAPTRRSCWRIRTTYAGSIPGVSSSIAKPVNAFSDLETQRLAIDRPMRISSGVAEASTAQDLAASPVDKILDQAQRGPDDLYNVLKTSYMDALYVSKASVAYFAKGPLTRSRNAQYIAPRDLCSFYRDRILPIKKIDHKYRESFPMMVRAFGGPTSDNESAEGVKAVKKTRSKKKKLGRNGLWPEEEGAIKQWWSGRAATDVGPGIKETVDEEMKRLITDLRLRETQLQILLILETIVLESTKPDKVDATSTSTDTSATSNKVKREAKKPQDLKTLLDLHLDRLCIWQAVSTDVSFAKAKEQQANSSSVKRASADAVRDFCTEVIVPFYASRLPEQCKAITHKLGGPPIASPPRPPMQKSHSTSQILPGSAIKRPLPPKQPPAKQPRTLQRVLTDDKIALQARSGVPSLSRSSTAPGAQRDVQSREPSLPPKLTSRGGIQAARRMDNREVDLVAVAKQHESKVRRLNRMMEQKKELDEAIQTIRKPNRDLVSKELADESQKRGVTTVATSSKKKRAPVRNALGQGAELSKSVQVTATPRKTRRPNLFTHRSHTQDLPSLPSMFVRSPSPDIRREDYYVNPCGSDMVIPSSAIRPDAASSHAIRDTPSRAPMAKRSDPLGLLNATGSTRLENSAFQSPIQSQSRSATQVTPTLKRSFNAMQEMPAPTSAENTTSNIGGLDTPESSAKRKRAGLFKSATIAEGCHVFETPVRCTASATSRETSMRSPELPRARAEIVGPKFGTLFWPTSKAQPQSQTRTGSHMEPSTTISSSPPLPKTGPQGEPQQHITGFTATESSPGVNQEDDIYGALGWNNDDYDF